MFLYIMRKRAFSYVMQEKLQYYNDTISHIFYKVLSFLLYLYMKTINLSYYEFNNYIISYMTTHVIDLT